MPPDTLIFVFGLFSAIAEAEYVPSLKISYFAHENHHPNIGESGIINTEKIIDDTEISVAR